jgi:hypothetical protein
VFVSAPIATRPGQSHSTSSGVIFDAGTMTAARAVPFDDAVGSAVAAS